MRLHNLIPLFFVLGAGCADLDESGELDGIDDDLPAGDKADTGTLAENTPDAYTVLQVANHADLVTLVLKVRLGAQAAGAIIATRLGDDGVLNTGDDIKFASLRELDEVTWVGPKTFERLRDWGKQNGYGMPDLHGSYRFHLRFAGTTLSFSRTRSRVTPRSTPSTSASIGLTIFPSCSTPGWSSRG